MQLDEIDMKVLLERFDTETIKKLDLDNVAKIYSYLLKNGIYFSKDIFLGQADLFLMDYKNFEEKFETLKIKLGNNYVELLGEDCSLINFMYQ